MEPSALTVKDLQVWRSAHWVLGPVSFSVDPGELVVIIGPSGAGKTTLLRAIAGLQPSSGKIFCGDEDVSEFSPGARASALVADRDGLFPHLTVQENVALAGGNAEDLQVTLTDLGLSSLARQYPGSLSTGQRQMVALARALLRRPRWLLFDEPLAHVDPYSRLRLRGEILRIHRRIGAASLYVTHDLPEAYAIADRIILLREGKIIQDDYPQDLVSHPADLQTALYLGATTQVSTNALINTDRFGQVSAQFTAFGQSLEVPAADSLASANGQTRKIVALGSPYSVEISNLPPERKKDPIQGDVGQVVGSFFEGDTYLLQIETEFGVLASRRQNGDEPFIVGDRVAVKALPTHLWAVPA